MKVLTKVGAVEVPPLAQCGPRTKFWAEAVSELARTEELYQVMGAALEEAYRAGVMSTLFRQVQEVVDAEDWSVVEADQQESGAGEGPQPAEPDVPGDGSGPAEPPAEVADVPGCDAEGTEREPQHEAELEEGPKP